MIDKIWGWIGVDLDGTLAEFTEWKGEGHIGKPVPLMLERVNKWLSEGRTVRIFTSRAEDPQQLPYIRKWLIENGLPQLQITNVKDHLMTELYDDKARQVEKNTGIVIGEK